MDISHTRKQIATTVCLLLTLCLSVTCGRRNVLVIVGDDMGFEMGAYNNSVIDSPNLDHLAQRSVLFRNAFTSVSSCSPSRSAILTGLPQHQNGMYGLHHSIHHFSSFDKVKSLPKLLNEHNIRTGIIGKKHVGPDSVYPFNFSATEEEFSLMQCGRNITFMKELTQKFLGQDDGRPFLLYVGFFDPHRCALNSKYGGFCEKFGDGSPGMGDIPDWKPLQYDPDKVQVPWFLPDTPGTRSELAAQYRVINRMDQGIGLILQELDKAGHLDDTLILFTSDNGIPFPGAKTNLYVPGMGEPMLLSSPVHREAWGKESDTLVGLLDIVPTILDWFHIKYPSYRIMRELPSVRLTGKSLLSVVQRESELDPRSRQVAAGIPEPKLDPLKLDDKPVFASHDLHEVTMYYPMRVIQQGSYRLIHNLNNLMPFPLASDLATSKSFMDIFKAHSQNTTWPWFKSLKQYYYRAEWELYDVSSDPSEMHNLAADRSYADVFRTMKDSLYEWLATTMDPWICLPGGVLLYEGAGDGKEDQIKFKCLDVYNGFDGH